MGVAVRPSTCLPLAVKRSSYRIAIYKPFRYLHRCTILERESTNISTRSISVVATTAVAQQAGLVAMDSASAFTVPAEVFVSAARVTAAYAILFGCLLVWQGVSKLRMWQACMAKKEPFDRYNDKRMLPYDRTVGNMIEWAVPFLCLFWISMILTNGATVKWGWLYVAARTLYPVMALNKGIGAVGAKGPILLATFPGYVALIAFIIPTVKALL